MILRSEIRTDFSTFIFFSFAGTIGLAIAMSFIAVHALLEWAGFPRGSWRRRQGLCEYCGYDLRATPERCPECGRKV
jgi:hypothetical protein